MDVGDLTSLRSNNLYSSIVLMIRVLDNLLVSISLPSTYVYALPVATGLEGLHCTFLIHCDQVQVRFLPLKHFLQKENGSCDLKVGSQL